MLTTNPNSTGSADSCGQPDDVSIFGVFNMYRAMSRPTSQSDIGSLDASTRPSSRSFGRSCVAPTVSPSPRRAYTPPSVKPFPPLGPASLERGGLVVGPALGSFRDQLSPLVESMNGSGRASIRRNLGRDAEALGTPLEEAKNALLSGIRVDSSPRR